MPQEIYFSQKNNFIINWPQAITKRINVHNLSRKDYEEIYMLLGEWSVRISWDELLKRIKLIVAQDEFIEPDLFASPGFAQQISPENPVIIEQSI